MSQTGYDQGDLLQLADVIQLIGCRREAPADHKNEWLQKRFSLYPAGRFRRGKANHLLWRKRDVLKAKAMLEPEPTPGGTVTYGDNPVDMKEKLLAMEAEAVRRGKPKTDGPDRALIFLKAAEEITGSELAVIRLGHLRVMETARTLIGLAADAMTGPIDKAS